MAELPEKRVCLKCQHVNPETATVCEQCGTPLKPTTVPVPDIQQQLAMQAEAPITKKRTDELVKQIALWVRNEPKPVLVDIGRGHVLGRRTSASDPPDLVDLTEYGAYRLGVSRRHAQFECTEDGCIVIDLGSSNGTWVNGLRLEPYQPAHVKSGDRINLGRMEFSIGYALSDAPPSAPPPETQFKTEPHLAPGSPALTGVGKVDTDPDPVASTLDFGTQPEEGTPAKEAAAKEAAEQPSTAKPADAKPSEAKPADAKPDEDGPAVVPPLAEITPPAADEVEPAPNPTLPMPKPSDTNPAKPETSQLKSKSEAKPSASDEKPSEGDKKPPASDT